MLSLLTLLATCAFAVSAPIDIHDLASESKATSLAAAEKKWTLVTAEAPWSARAGGTLEFQPDGKFLLHGVGIYDQDDAAWSEVWTATENGKNLKWTQVQTKTDFEPLYSSLTTMDVNGVHYRIQGSNEARDAFPDVWRSSDSGRTWTAQHAKARTQLEGTRYLGAAVNLVSNPDVLLIWGGQASFSEILSDVWRSTDKGVNWKFVVDTAEGKGKAFGQRSVNVGLATIAKGPDGGDVDVVYQMMGYVQNDAKVSRGQYSNDIWISYGEANNIGLKWHRIHEHAPWIARGDAAAEMSSSGVLVLSSGVASYSSDETAAVLNDVWASLDGGYSWGLCQEDAEFEDRRFQYSAVDSKGHLWVMGGRTEEFGRAAADVWKSVHSFNDVDEVARQCNLLVPSCGAGLKCLPGTDDPTFQSGMWGVTCAACPNGPIVPNTDGTPTTPPSENKSSTSSIMTVALVIAIIVAVGAAAAAYHFYRKSTAAASASTEQTWWGKNGTSSLVGGDAQAPSDAMYNPLNIRDSNATM